MPECGFRPLAPFRWVASWSCRRLPRHLPGTLRAGLLAAHELAYLINRLLHRVGVAHLDEFDAKLGKQRIHGLLAIDPHLEFLRPELRAELQPVHRHGDFLLLRGALRGVVRHQGNGFSVDLDGLDGAGLFEEVFETNEDLSRALAEERKTGTP